MREVVIDLRDGGDWSLDLCFAGLRQNLGVDAVWDIPWKKKHREWAGVLQGYTTPDWGLERRTLGYVKDDDARHLEGLTQTSLPAALVKRVWLDERMESFQKYRELGYYDAKVPVVVVAGHDRFWNQSPAFVAGLYGERLQAMLLDNWYSEYANLPFKVGNVRWSCNFDHYWTRPKEPPEKDIDILFIGYNSHPDRKRFVDHIRKSWPHLNNHVVLEERPDSFDQFIPRGEMFDLMLRSKICLNLRGAADRGKTLRAYEIPYVGSYMLSQLIDDPGFMDDFQGDCRFFCNEHGLDSEVRWALDNPEIRENIAARGNRKALSELSSKARWKSVLEWLDK